MAGEFNGHHGPVKDVGGMQPIYLDVTVPAGAAFTYKVPEELNVFSYIFEGKYKVENEIYPASNLLLYKQDGTDLKFEAAADTHARFLIVAGKPIREPMARYGPFVMNTREEIMQAFKDFQDGVLQQ
jgi:quercetin 2,3-dioxygenase